MPDYSQPAQVQVFVECRSRFDPRIHISTGNRSPVGYRCTLPAGHYEDHGWGGQHYEEYRWVEQF